MFLARWKAAPLAHKAGVVAGVGIAGLLLVNALLPGPKPVPRKKTETHTKTETRTELELKHKADERQKIIDELQQRLNEKTEHQANVTTKVVRVERYAPQPAPQGQPSQPGSIIPIAVPTPIEVTTTTETTDNSRDTRSTMADSTRKTDTDTEKRETTDAHKTETAKSETTTKTEEGGSGERHGGIFSTSDGTPRLGIGGSFGQKGGAGLTLTYDLYNKPLFPKVPVVNKIRAGLGVFGELPVGVGGDVVDFKHADFGPQVNIGTKRVFVFGEYRVRRRDPAVGIGFRIPLK